MTAPWKPRVRRLLLLFALACFAAWALLLVRRLTGTPETQAQMWWRTGILLTSWAAWFAYRALEAPPEE